MQQTNTHAPAKYCYWYEHNNILKWWAFLILGMRWKHVPFIIQIHVLYHNFAYAISFGSAMSQQANAELMRRAWYVNYLFMQVRTGCDYDCAYICERCDGWNTATGTSPQPTKDTLRVFSCVCKTHIIIIIGLYLMPAAASDRFPKLLHSICVCCGLAFMNRNTHKRIQGHKFMRKHKPNTLETVCAPIDTCGNCVACMELASGKF